MLQAQSPSDKADVTLIFARSSSPAALFSPLVVSAGFSVSLTLSSLTMMCLGVILFTFPMLDFIGFLDLWVYKCSLGLETFWPLFKYSSFRCFFLHFSSLSRDSSCPYIKPFEVGKSSNVFFFSSYGTYVNGW